MSPPVRDAGPADAASILSIYAPFVEETAVSFETDVPSVDEMAARIEGTSETYPWLVHEDGEVCGYAYACAHRGRAAYRWSVETSAYVAPDARRRGVARALYAALFELLALQGFVRAHAGIAQPNEASERFHAALGFERVGVYPSVGHKRGAWHDVA
ncbi:MAG: N-acetyltransferase family protein, partial [Planctomycetota bacterium]